MSVIGWIKDRNGGLGWIRVNVKERKKAWQSEMQILSRNESPKEKKKDKE